LRKPGGFTLIEMMIVLAIIGGMAALAMPYINSRNSKTRTFLRKMTVLSRELHTRAKLQGAVYRLVLDLKKPGDPLKPEKQQYWVEKAAGHVVMKANEEEAEIKRLAEDREEDRQDPRGFAPDPSLVKEPTDLPSGMHIDRVELTRVKDPIVEGKVYVHYLPQGLTDEAAIHLKGDKTQVWTISIHPLTGKAELISKQLTLKEIRSQ